MHYPQIAFFKLGQLWIERNHHKLEIRSEWEGIQLVIKADISEKIRAKEAIQGKAVIN